MVPKFDDILFPLLKYVESGKVYKISEIWKKVRDKHFPDMTEKDRDEVVKSGRNRFYDRILWAKTYLYKAGLLELPGRGEIKITAEGKKVLETETNVSVDFLYENYESFRNFKNKKGDKSQITSKEQTPEDAIESGFDDLNAVLKDELQEMLSKIDPYFFEKVILQLLKKMGYGDFVLTKKSRDGGIDGIMKKDVLGIDNVYVQVKRYQGNVPGIDIRNFKGALSDGRGRVSGIFVTTSDFTDSAKDSAKNGEYKIILINGDELIDYMIKYNVGVEIEDTYYKKRVNSDYFTEFT